MTYKQLQKKYGLPDYSVLNRYFDLEDVDPETSIYLAKIREKITERFETYAKHADSLLQPESNMAPMYEAHYTNEKDRKKIYSLFKRLMAVIRHSQKVTIKNEEKENAAFITSAYKEWEDMSSDLEQIFGNLVVLWQKESTMREDMSYFG